MIIPGYAISGLFMILLSGVAVAANHCKSVDKLVEKKQAEQKIVLLERMTTDSMPAIRVRDSGSDEGRRLLSKAQEEAADARRAFESGCFSDASRLAAGGLQSASLAFRAAGESSEVARRDFQSMYNRAESVLDTISKQPEDSIGIKSAELAGMRRQLERAQALALQGAYADATPLLKPVIDRLERRLIDMFHQETLIYRRDFSHPSEEYDYLAEQYRGYTLLLETRANGRAREALIAASEFATSASREAANRNWTTAIAAMEDAIGHCERAVMLAGFYH